MNNDLSQNYKDKISVWSNNIPEIKKHDQSYKWIGNHHKTIYTYIKTAYTNLNTLKSHISVLASMLKLLGTHPLYQKKYSYESTDLAKEVQNISEHQELAPNRNFVSLDEIEARRDELLELFRNNKSNNKLNLQSLMLSLYTYQPPIRQNYKDMLIVDKIPDNNNNNFILKKGNKYYVVIQDDKVVNTYGPANFELNDKLNNIIDESLQAYPRKYILSLMSDPNKPLGKQNFERLLNECMPNKKLSVDLLRSAYITHYYNKPNFTLAQKNDLAKKMRHSVNIAMLSYQKMNIPYVIDENE